MKDIKRKAQEVVWECERRERLEEAAHRLRKYDGEFESFQYIEIDSQFTKRPVRLNIGDLEEQAIHRIYKCIENEINGNLDNT